MSTNQRICAQLGLLLLFLMVSFFAAGEATFYESYQTALDHERAGRWQQARNHFLEAVAMNPAPAKRVKTYGLNFMRDYDPYAHLAYCEWRLSMLDDASTHLAIARKAGVTPPLRLAELEALIVRARQSQSPPQAAQQTPPAVEPAPIQPPQQTPAPAPTLGTLKVESIPPGAGLTIDGKERGVTPLETTLPAGPHEIRFQLSNHQPVQSTVTLQAGQTQTVSMTLTPLPAPKAATPPVEEKPAPRVKTPPPPTTMEPARTSTSVSPSPVPATGEKQKTAMPARQTPPVPAAVPSPRFPRVLFAGLLLVIAALALLLLRKHAVPQTTIATSTTLAPRKQSPSDDTPTRALSDDAMKTPISRQGVTPTPSAQPALEEVLPMAKPLPGGSLPEFAGYKIHGILGRGGMGITYLAARTRDGLPMAIKVPHDHLLDNEEFAQRFIREGSLGSTLHHPNIIRVYEAGVSGKTPFIAMELIQGETLESRLRRLGTLPPRVALEIVRDIALALDYARLKGIVHRDLKPENIMLPDRGGLKVMDYGIARIMESPGLTSSEAFLGTPSYSSPEAASGGVDQQSDLYSLGIILYRMLAGEAPFRSTNILEVLDMHRYRPLPPFPPELKIPEAVFQLTKKLTAKKKTERYANAEVMLIELNTILNQLE